MAQIKIQVWMWLKPPDMGGYREVLCEIRREAEYAVGDFLTDNDLFFFLQKQEVAHVCQALRRSFGHWRIVKIMLSVADDQRARLFYDPDFCERGRQDDGKLPWNSVLIPGDPLYVRV